MEYVIKIISYPYRSGGYEPGVIEVIRDDNGVDKAVQFLCPNGCGCKIYIPLGDDNNEGGSSPRAIKWVEKDKVLSITPSIELKTGCKAHFYITNNKVV